MSEAVCEALVDMGRERWQERIAGKAEPQSLGEMGLELRSGLEEEARAALAWAKLRKHHGDPHEIRLRDVAREWELAGETIGAGEVDDYIAHKIEYAAKKCAPFLRMMREEQATAVEPKRYISVYSAYLDDERLNAALTANDRFPVKGGDVLRTEDPKRVVFYWSELGMPVYRVESIDEYFERYNYVKRDELGRGKVYRWEDLPYQPKGAAAHAEHCEGRKVPDIPLHIDKRWEGAPDQTECLAQVAPKAVFSGQGRIAWLESRQAVQTARAGEALVQFVLAQCFELVVRREDERIVFANEDIPERDRVLGKFRDEAFAAFRQAKLPIREWLANGIDARVKALVAERDRDGAKALLGAHREALGKLRLQLEGKEQAFVEREYDAAEQALSGLLAKM